MPESERRKASLWESSLPEMNGCSGCGALEGHGYWCEVPTPEERVEILERALKHWLAAQGRTEKALRRQVDLVEMWHGKYAIVKHENNVLRRKLKRQEAD
jgi:hypothetical protein